MASSGYLAAALANLALMTRHNTSHDVELILPGVGAQISNPDSLRDGLDKVKSTFDDFCDSAGIEISSGQAAALKKALQDVDGDSGHASADLSAVIAIPNDAIPFVFVARGTSCRVHPAPKPENAMSKKSTYSFCHCAGDHAYRLQQLRERYWQVWFAV